MTIAAAAIKRGRKFGQVLAGARDVFLRDGFEGANVDDIAREAGVSKATLYSYFPDKRLLFVEVARIECARQADAAIETLTPDMPPAVVLHTAATRLVAFMTSDFGRQMYRTCVAESGRFPEIGRAFYESGPKLVRDRLGAYLRDAVARGQLVIDDIDLAADQFAELCKASIHACMVFGMTDCCTPAMHERTITGAVEMFMARYGAKAA